MFTEYDIAFISAMILAFVAPFALMLFLGDRR